MWQEGALASEPVIKIEVRNLETTRLLFVEEQPSGNKPHDSDHVHRVDDILNALYIRNRVLYEAAGAKQNDGADRDYP